MCQRKQLRTMNFLKGPYFILTGSTVAIQCEDIASWPDGTIVEHDNLNHYD